MLEKILKRRALKLKDEMKENIFLFCGVSEYITDGVKEI